MLCSCRADIIQLLCLLDPSLLAIVLRVAKLELLLKELTISDQDLPATLPMDARLTPLLPFSPNQDQLATLPMDARLILLLLYWLSPNQLAIVQKVAKLELLPKESIISDQDPHATPPMDAKLIPLLLSSPNQDPHATLLMDARLIPLLLCWLNKNQTQPVTVLRDAKKALPLLILLKVGKIPDTGPIQVWLKFTQTQPTSILGISLSQDL